MRIAKSVEKLEAYVPGEQPASREAIKLNTNENPYPPSPECAKVLQGFDLELLRRYPDPNFVELRKAIAKANGCQIENVFVGNGSDEILSLAAKAFVENDEAIGSLDPSYSLYKTLAAIRDVRWLGMKKEALQKADALDKAISLFLWTNPNAPTGEWVHPSVIARFARGFPGVLIVDEAYGDFAPENCIAQALEPGGNTMVMRTFSKSYSLAGMRVGYLIGPVELIGAMFKIKDSYNVDAVAQAVALAAFNDCDYHRRTVAKVVETRERFAGELRRRGWDVIPSQANFVFAKPPSPQNASGLHAALKERNIFVRYFPGPLTGERLRITVGTEEQIAGLLAAIDDIRAKIGEQP